MAEFQAHIDQAKKNLIILSEINHKIEKSWDWQVTTCYYVGVHLINAHLALCANMHYSSHEKVKNALFNEMSPARIDDNTYLSYVKLENLSRRARYLCNDNRKEKELDAGKVFFTHSIHLNRALNKLDSLMGFVAGKYDVVFEAITIDCLDSKSNNLRYFNIS